MSRRHYALAAVASLALGLTLAATAVAPPALAADPAPAAAPSMPAFPGVGFQYLQIPDASGTPVEVGVWYPAPADAPLVPSRVGTYVLKLALDAPVRGAHLPLVVMSHGNGGEFSGHWDTAVALAQAGFVVAALTHPGDNWRDQSRAVHLPDRPLQLKHLLDYMTDSWPGRAALDPARIGAFGFSAGGFTVLALAGGEPDLGTVTPHCAAHPDYYDCTLVRRFPGAAESLAKARPAWTHDTRIRAVVSAAPAVGFAFGKEGLKGVTVPVQLWRAEKDHILPHPLYAQAVRDDLPTAPDYHEVAGADHFDFLVPCNDILRKSAAFICQSLPGFDRAAFHETFDREVVAFFRRTLGG